MIVTGWNNGSPSNNTGAGYGIPITAQDRDKYFKNSWSSVKIELEGGNTVEIRLTKSFWKKCPELRSVKIGKWMIEKGFAPWPNNKAPKFQLEHIAENGFRLITHVLKNTES